MRRLPTSTLFPYTTLFLSGSEGPGAEGKMDRRHIGMGGHSLDAFTAQLVGVVTVDMTRGKGGALPTRARRRSCSSPRSEEHTSELQSRQYLVCRLLLEKKK